MKAEIIKKKSMENLPSASGSEIIGETLYIIGDDTPFLYCLDMDFNIKNKIELVSAENFETGRIPKDIKPDLEAMSRVEVNGRQFLFICGSGSNENRETAFLVATDDFSIKEFSLSGLYKAIKETAGVETLNIEGLATDKEMVYFFDRENNMVITYPSEPLFDFLQGKLKEPECHSCPRFKLEKINNVESGFSGADIFDNKVFFTASVEDSPDSIQDGEVYGSFLGLLDFNGNHITCAVIEENGETFSGKVESVSVYQKDGPGVYLAVAATDDDEGGSDILRLRIEL